MLFKLMLQMVELHFGKAGELMLLSRLQKTMPMTMAGLKAEC
jgi:hypothetical protein